MHSYKKRGNVQIFRNDNNKSEYHSRKS